MTISLLGDSIEIHLPEVDPAARLLVTFQRTLRVPDDGKQYGLPPGFGSFPMRRVIDLAADRLPETWVRQGGVVLPMWQSEACWLNFTSPERYPFLMKVGCGGINAVTGESFTPEPDFAAEDYFEVPPQPWLDGFCVEKGKVRQFVAMPLHRGYTVEEQITGRAEHGGIQIAVVPLKSEVYQEREAERRRFEAERPSYFADGDGNTAAMPMAAVGSMGIGAGGSITQSIETPVEPRENWDLSAGSRISVHIANSASWETITDAKPPTLPLSAADYAGMGFPWFDWYDDSFARSGSSILDKVRSVFDLGRDKGEKPLPENESFEPPEPIVLGRPPREVPSA